MNRKIIIYIIIVTMTLFTGCQLAVEGADKSAESDKLVGFFITDDYIDLFDFDAFAADNIKVLANGELEIKGSQYEGRAYGNINPDDPNEVVFEGYEGVVFMDNTYEKDGETYSSVGSGNQISGVHIYVNDNGRAIKGTLYANSGRSIISVYMNPVYKTPEGQIYITSGTGISMDGGYGGSMSKTMSEEHTVREGSKEVKQSFEVEVAVECVFDAEYYIFKQVDKNDNIISAHKIYSDDIPDSIKINKNTEYVILEKVGADWQGQKVSERSIINDETYFNIYFFNGGAFAEHYAVQIERD